jgi:hypothetical protein
METEERIKALEQEIAETKDDFRQILLELRSFVLAAENPLKKFERMTREQQSAPEGGATNDNPR